MADVKTPPELLANLNDPMWRISHLYKIIIKGDAYDDENLVIPFKPNRAQLRFIDRLHHRSIILKARQLGFTTLIAIVWLDHALFNANVRCGIIAQDRDAAEVIFRDKVKFAYDNLPPLLKEAMPLVKDSASELLFGHNNSSIRVATSMRSGTIHRLHISEFGKICAKYPDKAKEVMTGSIPAVPLSGITIIESTAEGAEGEFHDLTQRAIAMQQQGKTLTERDYRFHFFPWHEEEGYEMEPVGVVMGDKDRAYFERIESEIGHVLSERKRAWYVATRDADFTGKEERMWQEYPSTPKEAFQQSTEGAYYANQMAIVRKQGRICTVPVVSAPVNTFWDIGNSDGCAVWFHQQVGLEHRFINYYEAFGENLAHYYKALQDMGYILGRHYFPHDADHKRLSDDNRSVREMMEGLGLRNIEVVERITNIGTGIEMTRNALAQCWFDEAGCKDGITRLDNYKKRWSAAQGRYIDEPDHAGSEGPDAFRQFAQALDGGLIGIVSKQFKRKPGSSWRTA